MIQGGQQWSTDPCCAEEAKVMQPVSGEGPGAPPTPETGLLTPGAAAALPRALTAV